MDFEIIANITRRNFLQSSGALGFMGGAGLLAAMNGARAYAADTTGYKALVCVFFKGGMDHADTILPYDQVSYDQLRAARPGLFNAYNYANSASSRNRLNMLQLNASGFGGRQFALPPELAPLHSLYNSGDLAVVGNVGPLIEPTRRVDMEAGGVELPPRLYSHNDQQSTWMSLGAEGSRYGWGGRFCSWTNRLARWTRLLVVSCRAGWLRPGTGSEARPCSSPMTRTRRSPCRIGSS